MYSFNKKPYLNFNLSFYDDGLNYDLIKKEFPKLKRYEKNKYITYTKNNHIIPNIFKYQSKYTYPEKDMYITVESYDYNEIGLLLFDLYFLTILNHNFIFKKQMILRSIDDYPTRIETLKILNMGFNHSSDLTGHEIKNPSIIFNLIHNYFIGTSNKFFLLNWGF